LDPSVQIIAGIPLPQTGGDSSVALQFITIHRSLRSLSIDSSIRILVRIS